MEFYVYLKNGVADNRTPKELENRPFNRSELPFVEKMNLEPLDTISNNEIVFVLNDTRVLERITDE